MHKPKKDSNFPFLPKDRTLLDWIRVEASNACPSLSMNQFLEKIVKEAKDKSKSS